MSMIKTFFQHKSVLATLLATLLVTVLVSMSVGQQNVSAATSGPCDIYAAGGTPCAAAHSTVRALFAAYNGNLYQVRRASNGATMDIGVLEAGGFANSAAQETFCSGTTCTFSIIYDQSGYGNHLTVAPAGGAGSADTEANAANESLYVGGHKVYSVKTVAGNGYRDNTTSGIPTGSASAGTYAVFNGTYYNSGCCYDYGNAETNNLDIGDGYMGALYFGSSTGWGRGAGSGPWVMADLENGLFAGGTGVYDTYTANPSVSGITYLTAIVKNSSTNYGIREGNAQSGSLTTIYNGLLPNEPGYRPLKLQGAIILGIGGDNSKQARGTFYEGAMVQGWPSDATEDLVQANIVAAGYGSGSTATNTPTPTGTLTNTPTPTATGTTPPPSTNPIAWYKFDETSGTSAADASGNGKTATLNGGATWVAGQSGNAVSLSGSSQYVSMPSGVVSGLSNFTIATWVKLDTISSWSRIFDFGTGTSVNMFLAPQNGSTSVVRFAITTGGNSSEQVINGTAALSTGVWTHVTVTKSGNTGALYVNGSQVGTNTSMTLSPSSLGSTTQNWIGRSQYSADPYLDGAVDDFRIYNRALSLAEVQALASTSTTPTPTATTTGTPTRTPTPTNTPTPTATGTSSTSITYQAESATLSGVSVDTNHTGYNGTGFVNFPTTGGYVEFRNVDGGSGGSKTLQFRFALGVASSRTGQMTINGTAQNITFQPTGSWTTWSTMTVTVTLNAGTSNTIRLSSTGQDLANLDQVTIN